MLKYRRNEHVLSRSQPIWNAITGANVVLFVTKILMRLDIWFHHKMQMKYNNTENSKIIMLEIHSMFATCSTLFNSDIRALVGRR